MKTPERRQNLKESLIDAAEEAITEGGLGSLRARTLADRAGCAVGAIYNVVADLDELTLLVNLRTLEALERHLVEAIGTIGEGADRAVEQLLRLSHAYLDFAAANRLRWRAVFEHRLSRDVPDWYLDAQMRLFALVEEPLRELQPRASGARRATLARTLFSAAHGIVTLGLEEKLQTIPLATLHEQVAFVVRAIGRGMQAGSSV
jgi:AcrR family transcriptional regulator